MGNSTWQGVRRSVLPSIGGKNTSTLSHGLVAAVASRRARHDVVLVVNVSNALYFALGRYSGQPVVLTTDGQEWLRGKWGRAARGIFHGSAKIAGRCATALVADCEAMAEVYRTEFGANSTVIPYCVPLSGLTTAALSEAFAKLPEFSPNRELIGRGVELIDTVVRQVIDGVRSRTNPVRARVAM